MWITYVDGVGTDEDGNVYVKRSVAADKVMMVDETQHNVVDMVSKGLNCLELKQVKEDYYDTGQLTVFKCGRGYAIMGLMMPRLKDLVETALEIVGTVLVRMAAIAILLQIDKKLVIIDDGAPNAAIAMFIVADL